jgi:hypothetical protein
MAYCEEKVSFSILLTLKHYLSGLAHSRSGNIILSLGLGLQCIRYM